MTLSGYFMLKSVFDQQDCRALTFALAMLSCYSCNKMSYFIKKIENLFLIVSHQYVVMT